MDIRFIGNTKVAIIENVIPAKDCKSLHDYVVDAKLNNLDVGIDSIEDGMKESEETIQYWKTKNVFLSTCPLEHINLGKELHLKQNEIFREYLEKLGLGDATYDSKYLEPIVVHLYRAGDNLDPHKDNNEYALVFYLSSPPEFTGGDLYYPNLNIKITPTRGTLVISPSNELHEVMEVISGYRCAITSFISLN